MSCYYKASILLHCEYSFLGFYRHIFGVSCPCDVILNEGANLSQVLCLMIPFPFIVLAACDERYLTFM